MQSSTTLVASSFRSIVDRARNAIAPEPDRVRPDLVAFAQRVYPWYQRSTHGDELAEFVLNTALTPNGRGIVVLPPRHSKSVHVSEALPSLILGEYPEKRVMGTANTQGLANKFSRRVRDTIDSPSYPYAITLSRNRKAVEEWEIAGHRGGYMAVGRGGTPTGSGADLLIIDDPIRNQADADSKTTRDFLYDWFVNTLRTRLEPDASIIICATRWHEDDLTGRLLEAAKDGGEPWKLLHMPAIDKHGRALWPERWPLHRLERVQQAAKGTRLWQVQYQGEPTKPEGDILKRQWWGYWQPRGADLGPVRHKLEDGRTVAIQPVEIPPWFDAQMQSWDMNFGTVSREEAKAAAEGQLSYVVGLVAGVSGPHAYMLDCYRERVDFLDSLDAFRKMSARWPNALAKYVEAKANGPAIISTLRNEIPGIVPIMPKGPKDARARAQAPALLAGNWILPHPKLYPWVDRFISELAEFPRSATNDQVDAWSQLSSQIYGSTIDQTADIIDEMSRELGMEPSWS